MKKITPYLFFGSFALLVALRMGYVTFTYYGHSFDAYAEENNKNDKEKKEKKLENVTDRILSNNSKQKENNVFAGKIATKPLISNPENTCITGVMLKDALKKLAFLDKKQAEILEQQRLLETSDRRVREQVAKLKLIKNEIVESAKLADSTIAKESKRLISIYEKMKPKDAANIFNEMQPNVAAELLRTMKEDQSSQILAKMNPKNAYNVTLSLAGGIKETEKQYDAVRKQ